MEEIGIKMQNEKATNTKRKITITSSKPSKTTAAVSQSKRSKPAANKKPKASPFVCAVCPVCTLQLAGNDEDLSLHVENCLEQQQGEFVEYEVNGEVRVRAVALQPRDPVLEKEQRQKMKDVDDELNVDQDENAYGPSQYNDDDLAGSESDKENEPSQSQCNSEPHIEPQSPQCSSVVVAALKEKIKTQEKMLQNSAKCLICMETYKKPLTSIVCWHCHCEQCWLMTLNAKKLCPQCNVITMPTDLRRIYL